MPEHHPLRNVIRGGDLYLQRLRADITAQKPEVAQRFLRVITDDALCCDITVLKKNIAVFQKQEIPRTLAVGRIEIEVHAASGFTPHFAEQ